MATDTVSRLLDARALGRLQWRCRRGLLENDIFITRFFERHGSCMTEAQARAMETLMDLSDNDLLDLLLSKKEPDPTWAGAEVVALLHLMRPHGTQPVHASPTP
jgi:antitoxin CptB